jgi:hypothetical protein
MTLREIRFLFRVSLKKSFRSIDSSLKGIAFP